jgi:hypothetical protein
MRALLCEHFSQSELAPEIKKIYGSDYPEPIIEFLNCFKIRRRPARPIADSLIGPIISLNLCDAGVVGYLGGGRL